MESAAVQLYRYGSGNANLNPHSADMTPRPDLQKMCVEMGRNHRSAPGGAGVDPQRGGAAKKKLDPYLTPKGGQLTPKT